MKARPIVRPRRRVRRSHPQRRATDRYLALVQRVTLAVGAIGVIYGQAEMLGEPWRHIVAVACVAILVAAALWMKVT